MLTPQATSAQRQLAWQISSGIDESWRLLTRVYRNARRLVFLTNAQLLDKAALTFLDDLATRAQYAYTGPATGNSQGGSIWIYDHIQRLAAFDVTPDIAPKSEFFQRGRNFWDYRGKTCCEKWLYNRLLFSLVSDFVSSRRGAS